MTNLPLTHRQSQVDRENLLYRITDCILHSIEFQEILDAAVIEVRSFLETDRVMIYQFHADQSGRVMAESIRQNGLPSLLGLNFPADDIPLQARDLFVTERVRSIVDVTTEQIGHSFLQCSPNRAISEPFEYRPLDPCHAQYLKAMGVESSLVVPVFYQDRLWGLLVSHHSEFKAISEDLLQGVQMVVDQLAVAIVQSTLLAQAREKAEREATINRIAALLHSFATIELQKALEETVAAFQGAGGRLFVAMPSAIAQASSEEFAAEEFKLYTCGVQPVLPEQTKFFMEQCSAWQAYFQISQDYQPWDIADLYQIPAPRSLQSGFDSTAIRSILIVPLQVRQQLAGYLSIFRDEVETETLWAGQFEPDERQLYPRRSFSVWRESKGGQVRPWTDGDVQLGQALGKQFAAAIEQNALYQRIQALNLNLESQVQDRTAKLAQALHDLQNAQTQLIQTEKMSSLGQLVAGIAHEINNPVNFIYGNLAHVTAYAEDLLDLIAHYYRCYPTPNHEIQRRTEAIDLQFLAEDLPKTLASMKMGADRIRQIVLSLRNFSRLDQAEMKLVDVHEGIDSTLLILQHRLKSKPDQPDIRVTKDYGDLPLVECYAGQLNQVFMNLISNAIDALEDWNAGRSPESLEAIPAAIRIRTWQLNSKHIIISIADNGMGMSETARHHLFDPFFTTKPIGKGTGLGLSISYQIVTEKHGGSLRCLSAPGQGAEFIIEIPIKQ